MTATLLVQPVGHYFVRLRDFYTSGMRMIAL
jgi:hypothetical protein